MFWFKLQIAKLFGKKFITYDISNNDFDTDIRLTAYFFRGKSYLAERKVIDRSKHNKFSIMAVKKFKGFSSTDYIPISEENRNLDFSKNNFSFSMPPIIKGNNMCDKKDQEHFGCSIETLEMVIDDEFNKNDGCHECYILDLLADAKKCIDKRECETQAKQKINIVAYIIETRTDW